MSRHIVSEHYNYKAVGVLPAYVMSLIAWLAFILLAGRAYCRSALFESRSSMTADLVPEVHLTPQQLTDRLGHLAIDNTLIVTQTNCGFLSFGINWVKHVQKIDINNFLVFTEDESLFEWIDQRHEGHAVMVSDLLERSLPHDSSRAATFGDDAFKFMVMKRPRLLLRLLEAGFNVLWTDSDAVLLQKPLPVLPTL